MKKTSITLFIATISSLFLSSCGHHMDVRPGASGLHRVAVQTGDKKFGARYALKQANHFCKERQKYATIVSEKQKYVGSMNESTYNAVRKASTVATTAGVGTGAYALARRKSSKSKTAKIAAAATAGGMVGKVVASDGYMTEMSFNCK